MRQGARKHSKTKPGGRQEARRGKTRQGGETRQKIHRQECNKSEARDRQTRWAGQGRYSSLAIRTRRGDIVGKISRQYKMKVRGYFWSWEIEDPGAQMSLKGKVGGGKGKEKVERERREEERYRG